MLMASTVPDHQGNFAADSAHLSRSHSGEEIMFETLEGRYASFALDVLCHQLKNGRELPEVSQAAFAAMDNFIDGASVYVVRASTLKAIEALKPRARKSELKRFQRMEISLIDLWMLALEPGGNVTASAPVLDCGEIRSEAE